MPVVILGENHLHQRLKLKTFLNKKYQTLNGTGTENRDGTIGNNGSWSLSLSRICANISTWYYTFHLVPVSASLSVNIP